MKGNQPRLCNAPYQVRWIWSKILMAKWWIGGGCGTFLFVLCCLSNALIHQWSATKEHPMTALMSYSQKERSLRLQSSSLRSKDVYNSDLVNDNDQHNSDTFPAPPEEDKNSSDGFDALNDTFDPNMLVEAIEKESLEDDINMQRILNAEVHLIDLRLDLPALRRDLSNEPYAGIYASFCTVDWSLHKANPNRYPMFIDLIQHSPECQSEEHIIRNVDLRALANRARQFDAQAAIGEAPGVVQLLDLTAVLFHESRCGSTLLANLFAAMHPEHHRVYSEPKAPMQAMSSICGEDFSVCAPETAAAMLQDVLYLMRRSKDAREERLFVKFPSIAARTLPVFTQAFPDTPHLLLYRDPVEVMVSHFHPTVPDSTTVMQLPNAKDGSSPAATMVVPACVAQRHSPGISVVAAVQKYSASSLVKPFKVKTNNMVQAKELSDENYCAAHLASITEQMVASSSSANAILLNYRDLPDRFYLDVLPQLFPDTALSSDALQRMQTMASLYSKNRGGSQDDVKERKDARSAKQQLATNEIREAAATYLLPSYEALETRHRQGLATERK
jgi:hypothetical protein